MTSAEELNTLILSRPTASQAVKGNTRGNKNMTKNSSNIFKRLLTAGKRVAVPRAQGIKQWPDPQ